MKIYGGYVGTISAQHTKNVTFIYPTQASITDILIVLMICTFSL